MCRAKASSLIRKEQNLNRESFCELNLDFKNIKALHDASNEEKLSNSSMQSKTKNKC